MWPVTVSRQASVVYEVPQGREGDRCGLGGSRCNDARDWKATFVMDLTICTHDTLYVRVSDGSHQPVTHRFLFKATKCLDG